MDITSRLTVQLSMGIAVAPSPAVRHFNDLWQRPAARKTVALRGLLECWIAEPATNICNLKSSVPSLLATLQSLTQELSTSARSADTRLCYVAEPPPSSLAGAGSQPEQFLTAFVDERAFARAVGVNVVSAPLSAPVVGNRSNHWRDRPETVHVHVALRIFEFRVLPTSEAVVGFEVVSSSLLGDDRSGVDCDSRRVAVLQLCDMYLARCSIADNIAAAETESDPREEPTETVEVPRRAKFSGLFAGAGVADPMTRVGIQPRGTGGSVGVGGATTTFDGVTRAAADRERLLTMRNTALDHRRRLRDEEEQQRRDERQMEEGRDLSTLGTEPEHHRKRQR
jgi:hypothetical protein